jgi:hypothetical protein
MIRGAYVGQTRSPKAIVLREAIKRYRQCLRGRERELLLRLVDNSAAIEAFARLDLGENGLERVLVACIEADELFRTFRERISAESNLLARLEPLNKALAALRKFVYEEAQLDPVAAKKTLSSPYYAWGQMKPHIKSLSDSDRLRSHIYQSEEDIVAMRHGLDLIAELVKQRGIDALRTKKRLGGTRKSKIKQARENASLGWLAAGVRSVTGRPHLRAVADLAQAMWNIEVDQDRVRRGETLTKREWRQR